MFTICERINFMPKDISVVTFKETLRNKFANLRQQEFIVVCWRNKGGLSFGISIGKRNRNLNF